MTSFIEIYHRYLELNPKFPGKCDGIPTNRITLYINNFRDNLEKMDTLDDFIEIVKNDLVCILMREDDILQKYLKVILKYRDSYLYGNQQKLCEIFYHLHFTTDDVNWLISNIDGFQHVPL